VGPSPELEHEQQESLFGFEMFLVNEYLHNYLHTSSETAVIENAGDPPPSARSAVVLPGARSVFQVLRCGHATGNQTSPRRSHARPVGHRAVPFTGTDTG
jgi:hypothetical protein